MQPTWYLIPGLGAEERVFRGLRLPGPATVLHWLPPQPATEPLRHYAARLAEAVPVGQPCWLVGVSFGLAACWRWPLLGSEPRHRAKPDFDEAGLRTTALG